MAEQENNTNLEKLRQGLDKISAESGANGSGPQIIGGVQKPVDVNVVQPVDVNVVHEKGTIQGTERIRLENEAKLFWSVYFKDTEKDKKGEQSGGSESKTQARREALKEINKERLAAGKKKVTMKDVESQKGRGMNKVNERFQREWRSGQKKLNEGIAKSKKQPDDKKGIFDSIEKDVGVIKRCVQEVKKNGRLNLEQLKLSNSYLNKLVKAEDEEDDEEDAEKGKTKISPVKKAIAKAKSIIKPKKGSWLTKLIEFLPMLFSAGGLFATVIVPMLLLGLKVAVAAALSATVGLLLNKFIGNWLNWRDETKEFAIKAEADAAWHRDRAEQEDLKAKNVEEIDPEQAKIRRMMAESSADMWDKRAELADVEKSTGFQIKAMFGFTGERDDIVEEMDEISEKQIKDLREMHKKRAEDPRFKHQYKDTDWEAEGAPSNLPTWTEMNLNKEGNEIVKGLQAQRDEQAETNRLLREGPQRTGTLEQDFVSRPGMPAISFNSKDDILGFKEGGPVSRLLGLRGQPAKPSDQTTSNLFQFSKTDPNEFGKFQLSEIKLSNLYLKQLVELTVKMLQKGSAEGGTNLVGMPPQQLPPDNSMTGDMSGPSFTDSRSDFYESAYSMHTPRVLT